MSYRSLDALIYQFALQGNMIVMLPLAMMDEYKIFDYTVWFKYIDYVMKQKPDVHMLSVHPTVIVFCKPSICEMKQLFEYEFTNLIKYYMTHDVYKFGTMILSSPGNWLMTFV